ncbi:hypothetical protein [Planktotalea sp.]|uniref:hypothetical protein n=1 Tax=Planktotalea sp. TaxID=2029877 RepID=UPI003F6CEE08
MKLILAATAATFTFGAVTAEAQTTPRTLNPPSVVQSGQWYIAPNGCSYSRTQAPGQAVQWMLIANPHHIGGRNATSACPRMLRG